ncbi:MAG: DegT/DnrJ/EryC1/StrS family aminotransferase [Calditrichaceae bacterium]|nr:DegT/DnrJ/EryC1/StrS family aminotransferase [Calditrichia bacterium]NUQ42886.1 DegT/DnrJ/EryC1/StrS family aminotransferase [Calditrichaceae bacterium]
MKNLVRLSKSVIGEKEIAAVTQILQKEFLGMGPEVQAFENDLAVFIGDNRQVVCVNTGTAALHLAVQACGIGPGDEVIIPSLTYLASYQAISATGATPVSCDVLLETGTIDPEDAAKRITPRTRAIMPVHYASGWGRLEQVYDLAQKHGLRVIEDAAHAFGGIYKGRRVGASGDIVCFSFDGIKNITSGEGGAVVTADPQIAEYVRDARLLGVQKDTEKRYARERSWEFDVTIQGWRFHMSDIMAAIGRVQLKRLEEFTTIRVRLAKNYARLLKEIPNIRLLNIEYGPVIPHIFPIFIGQDKRDKVRQALIDNNIQCGIHYKPNHLLSRYNLGYSLPVTEKLYQETLTLPLHPDVTEEQQEKICDIIRQCGDR